MHGVGDNAAVDAPAPAAADEPARKERAQMPPHASASLHTHSHLHNPTTTTATLEALLGGGGTNGATKCTALHVRQCVVSL